MHYTSIMHILKMDKQELYHTFLHVDDRFSYMRLLANGSPDTLLDHLLRSYSGFKSAECTGLCMLGCCVHYRIWAAQYLIQELSWITWIKHMLHIDCPHY